MPKGYYQKNRLRCIEHGREYRKNLKQGVYNHYGNTCICCGEFEPAFLTVDHINNDGAQHRKQIGIGSTRLYKWLKTNNYPKGFQILCANCNLAKQKKVKCHS